MRLPFKARGAYCLAAALALVLSAAVAGSAASPPQGEPTTAPPNSIACKVMEAKTAVGVTAAVVHQASSAERERVGAWIREHDGAPVEFRTSDGPWRPASIFRLRTCFGRGLLMFAAKEAHIEQGVTVELRLPGEAAR